MLLPPTLQTLGRVEAVKDRAGDVGELVDLLVGEPIEDQARDLLPVARRGGDLPGIRDEGPGEAGRQVPGERGTGI